MPLTSVPSTAGQGVTLSVFGLTEPTGWEQPAFDDSAWTATVLQPHVSYPNNPPGILGPPIEPVAPSDFNAPGSPPSSNPCQEWLFRQSFAIPSGTIAFATIRIRASFHADDIYSAQWLQFYLQYSDAALKQRSRGQVVG